MIERNGRNGRSFRRIDDIRRVKSAAKTDLEHDKIAVSLREPIKCKRGDELELRDRLAFGFELTAMGDTRFTSSMSSASGIISPSMRKRSRKSSTYGDV